MSALWPALGLVFLLGSGIVAAILYVRRAERDALKLEEEKADAETARRVLEAQNSAPRTPVDAARKLREHGF